MKLPDRMQRILFGLRRSSRTYLMRRRLTRHNATSPEDALRLLVAFAGDELAGGGQQVLVAGTKNHFVQRLGKELDANGFAWRHVEPAGIPELSQDRTAEVGLILLADLHSNDQLATARALLANPATRSIRLESVTLPRWENAALRRWDRFDDLDFVSPLLARYGDAFISIYRESLERFGGKTAIRDFLDTCQLIDSIERRGISGNIAEFGSFNGHSGYLTSKVLEKLATHRRLFMFDMFENFPAEAMGVDRFWSGSHPVVFDAVREKFRDRPNVALVKGDFTETLPQTETGEIALAYVDCDSYRSTSFLLPYLWEHSIPEGGIVAVEDYGHAALLGSRVAVHEFFDRRQDAFTFFSQYSGVFVATKLAAPAAR